MAQKTDASRKDIKGSITSLLNIVQHSSDTKGFWAAFIRQFASLCQANQAMLIALKEGQWTALHRWVKPEVTWSINQAIIDLAENAAKNGVAQGKVRYGGNIEGLLLAVKIDVGPQEQSPILLFGFGKRKTVTIEESIVWFAAGLPAMYQVARQYGRAKSDVVFFADILQLTGTLSEDKKFQLAVLRLCNEAAALFRCDQVSLGWIKSKRSLTVRAISNLESFEARANAVWELEAAMEESMEQEAEIIWPTNEEGEGIFRAHQAYAGLRRVGNLLTMPIRDGEKIVGALTCEREEGGFDENEIWRLRLLLEQSVRWLALLEQKDVWFGAKILRGFSKARAKIFKIEHTAAKLASVGALALVALLAFGTWDYRVEGTFLIKAKNIIYVSAPIDGFIAETPVRLGDLVSKEDVLAQLDTRSLLLDQSQALAKVSRYHREIEKARAVNSLGDMRIAMALKEELLAKVEQLKHQLANSKILAPFDGVVVEGDLTSRLGAPVRRGEMLMKVASLDEMWVEIRIDERNVHEIDEDLKGQISFVGRPGATFNITVEKLIPQARVVGGKNVFILMAKVDGAGQDWWRPGMSGVAKLDIGTRALWWVLSHKTIDYLRLYFWF